MTPSYKLGLFYILSVAVLLTCSSIIIQSVFKYSNFDSPFLLAYISDSVLILLLPAFLCWERSGLFCLRLRKNILGRDTPINEDANINSFIQWRHYDKKGSPSDDELPESSDSEESAVKNEDNSTIESTIGSTITIALNSESTIWSISTSNGSKSVCEDQTPRDQRAHESSSSAEILSHVEHFKIALRVFPALFVADLCFSLSLKYTSIASSTVLSSTSSMFAFVFALLCGIEKANWCKILGVAMGISGSFYTAYGDVKGNSSDRVDPHPIWEQRKFWGDMFGLLAAIALGLQIILIKTLCPHDESKMSMALFLGYMGACILLLLSPIALFLESTLVTVNDEPILTEDVGGDDMSFSPFNDSSPMLFDTVGHDFWSESRKLQEDHLGLEVSGPSPYELTWAVFGVIVLKGFIENVVCDFLWARAVILTSATIAAFGLGLAIPFAFFSDAIIMEEEDLLTKESVIGAFLVLFGFVMVALGDEHVDEVSETIHSVDEVSETIHSVDEIDENNHCVDEMAQNK